MLNPLFLIELAIVLFAVVLHEVAHGWVAEKCGDDTARVMGRITLNPIPHLDLFASILLPLFLIISRSPVVFASAKPVPINPSRFNNPRIDLIKVSLAGIAANLLLAVLGALLLWIAPPIYLLPETLSAMIQINLILAVFNLIPIPPLDGSRVVSSLLPTHLAYKYDSIAPYGLVIIVVLLATGILNSFIGVTVDFLYRLLTELKI